MNNYYVKTTYNDPYPKNCNHVVAAGNPGNAVNKAFRFARQNPEQLKGKRIKIVTFTVSLVGKIPQKQSNE